jgi:hypothetical protein
MLVNVLLFSILLAALALRAWRRTDHRADRAAVHRLAATQPAAPACFDPAKAHRLQPFGGTLSAFRDDGGAGYFTRDHQRDREAKIFPASMRFAWPPASEDSIDNSGM